MVKHGDNLLAPNPESEPVANAEYVLLPSPPAENRVDLVLEGGGVKGIGLVGAISVLEGAGYHFERIAGSSAGAIVGSLVAAGMTASQLKEVMGSVDYTNFAMTHPWTRSPSSEKPCHCGSNTAFTRAVTSTAGSATSWRARRCRRSPTCVSQIPEAAFPPTSSMHSWR